MLTPVRIRGKKARNKAPLIETPSGKPQRKEIPNRVEERVISNSITPKRTLSQLETLPVELIENIFLSCLEINLPRSSPYLAAALTSERIYRLLILLSFWDNPAAWWGNYVAPNEVLKMFRPIAYTPLDTEERKRLQTTILDCRWCTPDRIKGQVPALIYLKVQSNWFGWGATMDESDKLELDKAIWEGTQWRTFRGIRQNHKYELEIQPPFVVNGVDPEWQGPREDPNSRLRNTYNYRAVNVLHFPNKLLRGNPWTEEKLSFLEFLSKAFGHDERKYNISFSFHTAQEGIHNAIVEQNTWALRHLLRLDELFTRTKNYKMCFRGFYRLPAEHFRTAVRRSGDDPEILKLLVRASAESIPYDDPEITEWATDAQHRGDPFGKWLLDLMLMLPSAVKDPTASYPGADSSLSLDSLFEHGKPGRQYLMDYTVEDTAAILSTDGQGLDSWQEELGIP